MAPRRQPGRVHGGRTAGARARAAAARAALPREALRKFGTEILGEVLEVTYPDGEGTFLVRVVGYMPRKGWHRVSSLGLSDWDGEDFVDELDVSEMFAAGQVEFVDATRGLRHEVQEELPNVQVFGREIVDKVLHITYPDGEGAFLVRVVSYLPRKGWHRVSSSGLSKWDGEDFLDEIDVSAMFAEGQIYFVDVAGLEGDGRQQASDSGRTAIRKKPASASLAAVAAPAAAAACHTTAVSAQVPRKLRGGLVAKPPTAPAAPQPPFREEMVGSVVDVFYVNPPAEYRMRVTAFDSQKGWHRVESHGQKGLWDGETFSDVLNLTNMHEQGRLRFVEGPAGAHAAASSAATGKPRRSGRMAPARKARTWCAGKFRLRGAAPRKPPPGPSRPAAPPAKPNKASLFVPGLPPKQQAMLRALTQQKAGSQRPRPPGPAAQQPEPRAARAAAKRRSASWPVPQEPAGATCGRHASVALTEAELASLAGGAPLAGGPKAAKFGADICGHVVALTYAKSTPKRTLQVRILKYDEETGRHTVSSKGLSSAWTGEDFLQEVDINEMHAAGSASFVSQLLQPSGASFDVPRGRGGRFSDYGGGRPARGDRGGGAAEALLCGAVGEPPPGGRPRRTPPVASEEAAEGAEDPPPAVPPAAAASPPAAAAARVAEPASGEPESKRPRTAEADEGVGKVVDGIEELRRWGHALVDEEISFLAAEPGVGGSPDEGETEPTTGQRWIKAQIVGWWPQQHLPPVVLDASASKDAVRRAVFVAEVQDGSHRGDRWQLSLGDAMLAAVGSSQRAEGTSERRALLEVFAGSCELSLAFRRLGADADTYDLILNSDQDFVADETFLRRLEQDATWDIVHFSPPEDPAVLRKLGAAARLLHVLGRGFAIENGEQAALWQAEEIRAVQGLEGVETLSVDLQAFGAPRPMPVRLVTNRGEWLSPLAHPQRREGNTKRPRRAPEPARSNADKLTPPEELLRYTRAFCEAYAEHVLRGAASAAPAAPTEATGCAALLRGASGTSELDAVAPAAGAVEEPEGGA